MIKFTFYVMIAIKGRRYSIERTFKTAAYCSRLKSRGFW
nr:MAG TPA: hypothetical protein [Caudoviricetes sp.]